MFRQAEDVPMSEMGWVGSNFVDAIEYANGPKTSKWGKMRAEQGHAKPFGLKLVEVETKMAALNFRNAIVLCIRC